MPHDVRSQWQSTVETLAVVVVAASVAWLALMRANQQTLLSAKAPNSPALPREPVTLTDAQLLGESGAPVALLIYSDFQCPYCGRFARETLPVLRERYVLSGKVRLAFLEFPLPNHPLAQRAAEAAECAGRQGRFWPFHDELFTRQTALDSTNLLEVARSVGLDAGRFSNCLGGETTEIVQADRSGGTALGVSGTPTFFLGPMLPDGRVKVVRRLSGVQPLSEFERIFDQVFTQRGSRVPREQLPRP